MPRGEHYLDGSFGRGKGYTAFSAEEAAGIGILVVVLAVLLIIGCWYYKRRSGYKSLLSKNFGVITMRTSEDKSTLLGSKLPLQEYNSNCNYVVPDAPPAYDKISATPLPPPYAP
ncbi:melanoma antigen recognized by T-cells 1 [Hemicordylus capensis]|uniref:melanoma antigen recognized by T-cells 1 n=1 Tax=Hemicordylus capensis TaxID=884348 RepID=UPI002302FD52|nr:melanoma antigen recognized by T-cells 1 [Hemicordylus capensis]XP_053154520.1 melanoma antigen recognized by T-cells 1 [Hemicordylus capensis]XP_053154521.1 melanoma antigen recognized by T-cells 1 [Hemicordylus capensis]XP_053154522.1 melanoma antigen recognized by T-cells 1 [Hemicordylus capensis]XP_053154523.1 melanoma antigen recognized by T-cells 1 [Hemicordylus capensis]XP_053154524.1 melanoma antigen recognized by T-cells 1 [Hemicordylus capensis]XP_053154525.1 melanoma antigen rec